jgi:Flp pilus assembly protein TadB
VPQDEQQNTKGVYMPLVTIIIVLVIVGAALWAINTYIPMAKPVKTILNIVVVAVLCLWLLQTFGIIGSLRSIRVS